jgi:hypothetical protein
MPSLLLNLQPGDPKNHDITHVTHKIPSLTKIYPGNLDGIKDCFPCGGVYLPAEVFIGFRGIQLLVSGLARLGG